MNEITLDGKLSNILPAYNEEGIIKHRVDELILEMESWGCSYEVIVVDGRCRE